MSSKLYAELGHRFSENTLVQETWLAMSHDLEQQSGALQSLTPAYWRQLKSQEDTLTSHSQGSFKMPESIGNMPLLDAITLSLDLEEPIILKFYVPLIRLLRVNETNSALDFYILVKAHVTRLQRIVQSFSGDPILARRSVALMEAFEKEVQAPAPTISAIRTASHSIPIKSKRTEKARKVHSGERARSKRSLSKHPRIVPKRAKPLVKKVGIRRSRAR